ncbi:MAG: T9SS type A sorting domain-containing protein [Ignavibacteriales bacterium]|nr:T9SS type A sorting domain-containing protein [Ignavibacteriales bacterium]
MKKLFCFIVFLLALSGRFLAQTPPVESNTYFNLQCGFNPDSTLLAGSNLRPNFTGNDTVNLCVVLAVSEGFSPIVPYIAYYQKLYSEIKDYYEKCSFGKFHIELNIITKNIDIANGTVEVFSLVGSNEWPIVSATDLQIRTVLDSADKRFDFNLADRDKDGIVDHLCFCVIRQAGDGLNGVPSLFDAGDYTTKDFKQGSSTEYLKISDGNYNNLRCSVNDGILKMEQILFHELTHSLFLFPDVDHGMGDNTWYAMGSFDGSFGVFKGVTSMYNPLFRNELGWLSYTPISEPGSYNLKNCETDINHPFYVVENPAVNHSYTNRFIISYYDSSCNQSIWTKNLPIPENPANLEDKRGMLIWRWIDNGGQLNFGSFGSKFTAPIAIESAHGKWEWQNESDWPKGQKFRRFVNNEPIPNISSGLDSLGLAGTYTWWENIPNIGWVVKGVYPDYRKGSHSCMFSPFQPKDFNPLSNPSSNFPGSDARASKAFASDIALKNMRVVNGETFIDYKFGNEAYFIERSTEFKAPELFIDHNVTIKNNATVKIFPGTKIYLRNNSTLRIEPGSSLIADGVIFEMGGGSTGGIVGSGATVSLNNCTVNGGNCALTIDAPVSLTVKGTTIQNVVYGILVSNFDGAPVYIDGNNINSASVGVLLVSGSSASITRNTINSRYGVQSLLIPELNLFSNTIQNNGNQDGWGVLNYYSSGTIYGNTISSFAQGINMSSGNFLLGKNNIRENIQYGVLLRNQALAAFNNKMDSESSGEVAGLGGCNIIAENGIAHYSTGFSNAEIHFDHARATFNYPKLSGFNSIMDDRAGVPFNTSCLLSGALSSTNSLDMKRTYWGATTEYDPLSTRFTVPVVYSPVLNHDPSNMECANSSENYVILNDVHGNFLDNIYKRPIVQITLSAVEELYAAAKAKLDEHDLEAAALLYTTIIENYGRDEVAIDAYYSLLNLLNITDAAPIQWEEFAEACSTNIYQNPDPDMVRFLSNLENNRLLLLGFFGEASARLDSIAQANPDTYEGENAANEKLIVDALLTLINSQIGGGLGKAGNNDLTAFQNTLGSVFSSAYGTVTPPAVKLKEIPSAYKLSNNYPNPFNPSTRINYDLPKSGYITIKLYDILGKEIATLVDEEKQAGSYILDFNASHLASGTYFYRIKVNDFTTVRKMVLIR